MVVLLFVFLFAAVKTWDIYKKSETASEKLGKAEADYEQMQEHEKDLSQKVSYISTNEGIQAEIRTKFRATEKGESVAVIVGDTNTPQKTGSSTPQFSWWQKILRFFGM